MCALACTCEAHALHSTHSTHAQRNQATQEATLARVARLRVDTSVTVTSLPDLKAVAIGPEPLASMSVHDRDSPTNVLSSPRICFSAD